MDPNQKLLSVKWNYHNFVFFKTLSSLRSNESCSDITIACDGNFYPCHKFVLLTCSSYFEEIIDVTRGSNSVIVLKDIKSTHFELLLDYMYLGDVQVLQSDLPLFIRMAENLKIRGLAVADEISKSNSVTTSDKKTTPQKFQTPKIDSTGNGSIKRELYRKRESSESISKTARISDSPDSDQLPSLTPTKSFTPAKSHTPAKWQTPSKVNGITTPQSLGASEKANDQPDDTLRNNIKKRHSSEDSRKDMNKKTKITLGEKTNKTKSSVDQELDFSDDSESDSEEDKKRRELACPHCDKVSNSRTALLYHVQTHTRQKEFACDLCPYTALSKLSIMLHKRAHTEFKTFACKECNFSSMKKNIVEKHMILHMKNN